MNGSSRKLTFSHLTESPRIPKHAVQMDPEELSPHVSLARKQKIAMARAKQMLPPAPMADRNPEPDQDLSESGGAIWPESNPLFFEKRLLAEHWGELNTEMLFEKHHPHPMPADIGMAGEEDSSERTMEEDNEAQVEAAEKRSKRCTKSARKRNQSIDSCDMGEVFYSDH